jgi:cytochrome c biogenesis protein CcmG/thiol:disulfide interchange protein DsbE
MDDVVQLQSSKRRHLITTVAIVVAAAAFIGLLAYGLTIDTTKVPPAIVDKAAQPFSVAWVQGQQFIPTAAESGFKLQDLKGRPVVLNFWASWCVSCREEAQELQRFWSKHDKDVLVVGIAIQDEKEAAKKFADYYGKTYALGLDEDGKAAIDYGVSGVPETFLIDRDGIIRHKEIGPVTVASLEALMPKIMR